MQKKIKELKTISSYRLEDFDNQATKLIKDGFLPLMPIQLGVSTPSYGPDGRFNCGSTYYYAQQFVKYEEE